MTTDAAKELLDLIMLDDFVQRRAALDRWERRWCTTLALEHDAANQGVTALDRMFPGKADLVARTALTARMTEALVDDECHAVTIEKRSDGRAHHYRLLLTVVLTKPREGQ